MNVGITGGITAIHKQRFTVLQLLCLSVKHLSNPQKSDLKGRQRCWTVVCKCEIRNGTGPLKGVYGMGVN